MRYGPLWATMMALSFPAFANTLALQPDEGIRFTCAAKTLPAVAAAMEAYLNELGIKPEWVTRKTDAAAGQLVYTLATPRTDTSTLDLARRPLYKIVPATLKLPAGRGKSRRVTTVSQKEIVLALLQHGRLTEFADHACAVEALRDHVGIRQNTVAWAEALAWEWPEGGPAKWNRKYWKRGTPKPGYPLHEAVNDAFIHQGKYGIGCYAATKLVMLQGVLDYYRRVKQDRRTLALLETRLLQGGQPLENVEPGRMWNFEKDFDHKEESRPGKLVRIQYGIATQNFLPGDWLYLLNTDSVTYEKTGYEGSNAIYLGRNRFDDYYNDHQHAYQFQQKLDEVYQWRNGVFSRSRDAANIKPLADADLQRLSATPAAGGLLHDFRVFPYFFGYEALP